jgi:hypothetical protein
LAFALHTNLTLLEEASLLEINAADGSVAMRKQLRPAARAMIEVKINNYKG